MVSFDIQIEFSILLRIYHWNIKQKAPCHQLTSSESSPTTSSLSSAAPKSN